MSGTIDQKFVIERFGKLIPLDELKPQLDKIIEDNHLDVKDGGIANFLNKVYRASNLRTGDVSKENGELCHLLFCQLRRHGSRILREEGEPPVRTMGPALRKMGYPVREVKDPLSIDEVETIIASLITSEIAQKAYDGTFNVPFAEFLKADKKGKRAYYAHHHRRDKGHNIKPLPEIINSLHPELQKKHKRKLYEAITNPRRLPQDNQSMRKELRKLFFFGEDLSRDILAGNASIGSTLSSYIRRDAFCVAEELNFLPGERPYSKTLMNLLGFPYVTNKDIICDDKPCMNHLGQISEGLLHLMLQIVAEYDPSGEKMGEEFRSFFPDGINQLYIKKKSKKLKVRPWRRGRVIEADARVVSDSLDTLIEMKSHKAIKKEQVSRIIDKYHTNNHWGDNHNGIDGKVSQKIMVLNCHNNGVEEQAARFEEAGWKVMMGDQFGKFCEKSLDLLLEAEPDFFRSVPYPIAAPGQRSTPERYVRHVKETFMGLHDLTYKNTHLLLRRGQRYFRTWAVNLLKESTNSLVNGERGEVIKDLPWKNVSPFKEFEEEYSKVDLSLEDEKVLFLDLETADWKSKGAPIINLGLGYYDDKQKGMVTNVYMVRNPAEERKALEHFVKIASQYDQIVTYNGKTFDLPFLISRLIAHRIDFDVQEMKHIDMYPIFRKVAKEKNYPHQRLQSYEKFELNIASRERDIPGKQIPVIYAKYLRDGQPEKVKHMIHHNQMDIVTLAVMYFDLHQEKNVKKK
jgi:uncharacterized protein YprB with RNaseH-like and TPR domain